MRNEPKIALEIPQVVRRGTGRLCRGVNLRRFSFPTGWVRKDMGRDGKKQRPWIRMDRVESLKYETLIMMAIDTGMRQGKVLGISIDQGENIKYIQTQLGHSRPSTTLDIYGHLMKTENPEAAKKRGELTLVVGF